MNQPEDDHDDWFRRQVAAGIAALDAGESVSHEDAMAEARDLLRRVLRDQHS